jgi:hypothetical protein
LSEEDWIASVHAANPEKLPALPAIPVAPEQEEQDDVPLSLTEVLPQFADTPSVHGDRPRPGSGGMLLHIGSSLALPSIPSIITPGNDTAYLTQVQQRLQQFEALQQQAIIQLEQQRQENDCFFIAMSHADAGIKPC